MRAEDNRNKSSLKVKFEDVQDEDPMAQLSADIDPSSISYDASVPEVVSCSAPNQLSSILHRKLSAVEVRNVVFGYKKAVVLNNINIDVRPGQICALLGASGCGKTTLLKILLGRLKPMAGTIRAFGIEPNSSMSSVPGPGVGYMPQELALTGEFTIAETLYYFGRLYHMDRPVIDKRIAFLVRLLNLPAKHRRISQLSGGQQRRVSIAVTLIHQPPLLVLDEPTVGVDPLLRCKIWEYLNELRQQQNVTVIITTHYIEEARAAGTVAMMRFGRILVQENPDDLMNRYECDNLEDVFLQLCQEDTGDIKRRMSSLIPTDRRQVDAMEEVRRKQLKKLAKSGLFNDHSNLLSTSRPDRHFDLQRILALLYKNVMTILKKPAFLFLFLFLPVIQIALIGISMGKKPHDLPVTVYNAEEPADLTQAFLATLDKEMLTVKECGSLDEAVEQVRKGKSWVAITMHPNFSSAFDVRATSPKDADDQVINDSNIKLHIDMSDEILGLLIYRSLIESYQTFVTKYLVTEYEFDPKSVTLPIKEQEVIYGKLDVLESYDNYIVPGNVIFIIYSVPLLLASFLLVIERKSGLLERSFVAGVRPSEIIVAHLIVLLVALLVQVILIMIATFVLFGIPLRGSLFDAFGLIYMQGFQGVAVGLLVSALARDEVTTLMTAFAIVFPLIMISGVLYPTEAMPSLIRTVFTAAPLTMPIEAFRSVLMRGWSATGHLSVALGYLVSVGYIIVTVASTLIVFRISAF